MVILDTNIIIDHIRRPDRHNSYHFKITQQQSKDSLGISPISIQEFYKGKSTKDIFKEDYLLSVISPLKIFHYTYEIAQLAGKLARDLPSLIEFADAAIAATALINNCELLTLNQKDFQGIKDLQLFQLKQLNP